MTRVVACAGVLLLALALLGGCRKSPPAPVPGPVEAEPLPPPKVLTPEEVIANAFDTAGIAYPPKRFAIIALKEERRLEIWAENGSGGPVRVETFPFTGFSGRLGPKLASGDKQIPEGVYGIEYLNPNSRFHLSLKISYPNAFDRAMAELDGRTELGGDIFIHGKASSLGCIPIGDVNIEKLFALAERVGKENIEVVVAPYDMRTAMQELAPDAVSWLPLKYAKIRRELLKYRAVKPLYSLR